jgi:DNA recombination protein RmuC
LEIVTIIAATVVVTAGVIGLVVYLNRQLRTDLKQDLAQSADMLEQRHSEVLRTLDQTTVMLGSMREGLGSVQEIGRQIGSLQDFLRSPKMRGNLGEEILKELLTNHLPKGSFAIQHAFKDGNTVDAIIKIGNRILPIDAKFPLENAQKVLKAQNESDYAEAYKLFRRDVKKHIDDISKKYIMPQEKTTDFAFMYVPSESIWYQAVKDDDELTQYARRKNVYLVSPNSFYYALQIVIRVMESENMQAKIYEVLGELKSLRLSSGQFTEQLSVLSRHISNAKKAMDTTLVSFGKLSGKIDGVSGLKIGEKELADDLPVLEQIEISVLPEDSYDE